MLEQIDIQDGNVPEFIEALKHIFMILACDHNISYTYLYLAYDICDL